MTAKRGKRAPRVRKKRPDGAGSRGPVPGEGGAPPIALTGDQLKELEILAQLGATQWEMASRLGISEDTLARRMRDTSAVAEAVSRGKSSRNVSLRREQTRIALNREHKDQVKMLQFLGRSELEQTDRVRVSFDSEKEALRVLLESFPELSADMLDVLTGRQE